MASRANGPVVRSPGAGGSALIARMGGSVATAFRLFARRVPAEEGTTLAGTLRIEWVAMLRAGPEAPLGRTEPFLLAVHKAQRLQFAAAETIMIVVNAILLPGQPDLRMSKHAKNGIKWSPLPFFRYKVNLAGR